MFKLKKLILILSLCMLAFLLVSCFIFQANYVPAILMYHSVVWDADPESRLEISVDAFERQMRFLKDNRYNVISLGELAGLISERKIIPPKTVAITLDDGYIDNYIYVFPILKKYNFCATIFIIVNEVGRRQKDRLGWEQIKEMQDSGLITVGSHCLGPKILTDFESERDLKKEIFDSKKILERKLNRDVDIFSYPAGRFNEKIRELVIRAGYKAAVSSNPGKKIPNNDLFALKRLRISDTSDNLFIFWIESSGFYNFIRENRHK